MLLGKIKWIAGIGDSSEWGLGVAVILNKVIKDCHAKKRAFLFYLFLIDKR